MSGKKLIFFVAADAAVDPSAVSGAFHFASTAAALKLDAEVRLAGEAVLVADAAYVATLKGSETLRDCLDSAVGGGFEVSVCPRSIEARGIRDEQVAFIGARPRPLAEILVEVAEGRSVLLHV